MTFNTLIIIALYLFGFDRTEKIHDFHTSITELVYNTSERTFEASIRVFSDDLDKVLEAENPSVKIIGLPLEKRDVLLNKYIQKHFAIILPNGQKKPMTYIGHEIEKDGTWLYVEIPFKDKLEGCSFQNDVFFETFNDQTNILNLKYTSLKKSFLFKDKKGVLMVD
jgi:hypothetical protein